MMKSFYPALIFFILFSPPGKSQEQESKGIIKLKVDLDSVTLRINNQIVDRDSSGNPLLPDAWFILGLAPGNYEVDFYRDGYDPIDSNIIVLSNKVSTFEARFLATGPDNTEEFSEGASLFLASDPDSARIIIETLPDTVVAPREFNITAGDHSFKAVADGCDDLNHNISIEPDKNISMKFILAFTQPPGLTAEDLDLEYMPIMPLKEEAEAIKQKEMFDNYAQTFALIPLGQGILGRLLLGKENKAGANILIVAGAGLTAGAYIMGRIIPKRKLEKIREYNEEAKRVNSEAKYHNEDIDSEVEEKNNELLENWILRNQDRGKVEITVE